MQALPLFTLYRGHNRARAMSNRLATCSCQYARMAAQSRATSSAVLCAWRQMRTRSVEAGTVGDRMGLMSKPRRRRALAKWTTRSLPANPTASAPGRVFRSRKHPPATRRPRQPPHHTRQDHALDGTGRGQHGAGGQVPQALLKLLDQRPQLGAALWGAAATRPLAFPNGGVSFLSRSHGARVPARAPRPRRPSPRRRPGRRPASAAAGTS